MYFTINSIECRTYRVQFTTGSRDPYTARTTTCTQSSGYCREQTSQCTMYKQYLGVNSVECTIYKVQVTTRFEEEMIISIAFQVLAVEFQSLATLAFSSKTSKQISTMAGVAYKKQSPTGARAGAAERKGLDQGNI